MIEVFRRWVTGEIERGRVFPVIIGSLLAAGISIVVGLELEPGPGKFFFLMVGPLLLAMLGAVIAARLFPK